jgi:hypothetical protein
MELRTKARTDTDHHARYLPIIGAVQEADRARSFASENQAGGKLFQFTKIYSSPKLTIAFSGDKI